MGNCFRQRKESGQPDYAQPLLKKENIILQQKFLAAAVSIPLEIQVAHFTPSSFPMIPTVDASIANLCQSSWAKIVAGDVTDDYGHKMSGMSIFYNEFYERLDLVDTNGSFEAVLSKHAVGVSKAATKGAILVRIIMYALKIGSDDVQVQMRLYMLGKSHAQKQIRPWQYSVFVQTLLMTVSSRLGTSATNDVMSAWVNLFAFIMRSMLPQAIKGNVVETELYINTSSEFSAGKIADEVAEVEEVMEMKKKMKHSQSGSEVSAKQMKSGHRELLVASRQRSNSTGDESASMSTKFELEGASSRSFRLTDV